LARRVTAFIVDLLANPWAPYLLALAVELVFLGYVKDDAYIEFRYATNAARGHGLTFNVGDAPVEGFTSFLWTVLLIVPAWLHVSLLPFSKLVGALSIFGCIAVVAALVRARGEKGGDTRVAQQIGRWLVATNASLLVWAQSGMEPAQAALAVVATVWLLQERRHGAAMACAAAAAVLRPECHVVFFGAAAIVAKRRAPLPALVAIAVVGAIHLWRWHYFGGLVPNTALVKGGRLIWPVGVRLLGELVLTCLAGVTIALSIVEAWHKRDDVALLCVGSILTFCAYLVRVGRDEMYLVRLFLPVWPLTLALAAPWLARVWRIVPFAVCASGLVYVGTRLHTVDYWRLGERSHVPLARIMEQHARPGDMVIFQDLGQTPWAAMELRFVDPLGLVDRFIAEVRWSERVSPYLQMPSGAGQAKIRDHLFALDPKLVAFVVYPPDAEAADFTRQVADATSPDDRERLFGSLIDHNPYYCGLHDDPRFRARFRVVDVVRRKDNYWFILYERA
jgi:hypothetical protein